MIFNKRDLSEFVKTKLAQELQKAQIGNFVKKKGAPPLNTTVQKGKPGSKSKASPGIDLGHQIEPGVIPIVYGHVGMSNTQFDLGQKPSEVDPKFVTQEVRFPISEGPIEGLAFRSDASNAYDPDNEYYYVVQTPDQNNPGHFKNIVLNDSFVVDPITKVANFKDVKFESTFGDGTTNKQSGEIGNYNPLLFDEEDNVEIDAATDPVDSMKLNDLVDVNAQSGSRHVLYWNTSAGEWQATPFNDLLNTTGATYDGGAGGTGGAGGAGGTGGTGGYGGIGGGLGTGALIPYTQWNPPPVHVHVEGENEVTTTVIEPADPGTTVTADGAPLRRKEMTTPYFSTDIDFADVDKTIDDIAFTVRFPQGIYKEITTVNTVKNGFIELCDSLRPLENSGNLECLTPEVTVAPDGYTSTTSTRVPGAVKINFALTTTLCGREFVLHDGTYYISQSATNEAYEHSYKIKLSEMNAGKSHISEGPNRGYAQIGPFDLPEGEEESCNTTDLLKYDFDNFTLEQYLAVYPDDILNAAKTVKVYMWIDNRWEYWNWFGSGFFGSESIYNDEYTCSTNAYLKQVSVNKPLDNYEKDYATGGLIKTGYRLNGPDHRYRWHGWTYGVNTRSYELGANRSYKTVISGTYSDTPSPQPLPIDPEIEVATPGQTGFTGTTGTTGTAGSAGTSGTVTVPTAPDVPTVSMESDATYSGDGNSDTVTLPSVTVTSSQASNTLTITLSGSVGASVDVNTLAGGVSRSGGGTAEMTLTGSAGALQTTLDSGLVFTSSTGTRGDITIDLDITSSEGSSKDSKTIRPEAVTEYTSPIFEFYISTAATGNIKATVNGKPIMNQIATSGTIEDIAAACASAITSYTSKPNWTASSDGNKVTGVGEAGIGDSLNGVIVENGADSPLAITTLDQGSAAIKQGVAPSRTSQPVQSKENLTTKFVPATTFTNPLNASDVAWFQLKYRPPQENGKTELSEVGVFVAGRKVFDVQELALPYTFEQWQLVNYDTSVIRYTNNPAWIFFDYLTNTRYGLGNDIKLTDDQKAALYADIYYASWWCCVTPTGDASQRLATFNGVFYGAESKYEALQKIADSFQGKFVYLNGNPRLIFDGQSYNWVSTAPSGAASLTYQAEVNHIVNQTNSAEMTYQSGSIDNLYNVINVKWNNPQNYFRQEEVQYRNSASIATYGERETTVELTGCTNKQQALWYGAWMFETEESNSEMVTYIGGWDHYSVQPGMLIHIADTLRVDNPGIGGRVTAVNGTTLTIDRDLGAGSYDVTVLDTNNELRFGTATGTTITASSGTFTEGAVFNTYSGTFVPTHRVVAIEESEDGIYAVTAQKFDPDKYTRIWSNTI